MFRFRVWSGIGVTMVLCLAVIAAAIGQVPDAFIGATSPGLPEQPRLPEEPPEPQLQRAPASELTAHADVSSARSEPGFSNESIRGVQSDPGTLTGFRGRVGEVLFVRVTGNPTAGSVYGSGAYTDDSTLATAVVHAGILAPGETGIVKVTILAGQANYDAAIRYGVTSYAYGQWSGSYRVDRINRRDAAAFAMAPNAVIDDPGNLTGHSREVGDVVVIRVTGTTDGFVWGTGTYTSDSDLSTAAVHAGLVQAGETRLIKAAILPGRSSYTGSTRNGVTSREYGSWGGSYRLSAASRIGRSQSVARDDEIRDDPGNVTGFHRAVGATLVFRVIGTTDGFVWGSDAYTFDSDLSTAAVHAGVLQAGETGVVRVTIQPVQFSFPGTARNGVTSRDWLPWDGNYRIDRVDPATAP